MELDCSSQKLRVVTNSQKFGLWDCNYFAIIWLVLSSMDRRYRHHQQSLCTIKFPKTLPKLHCCQCCVKKAITFCYCDNNQIGVLYRANLLTFECLTFLFIFSTFVLLLCFFSELFMSFDCTARTFCWYDKNWIGVLERANLLAFVCWPIVLFCFCCCFFQFCLCPLIFTSSWVELV